MAGLGMSVSKPQQGSDGQMGARAPAQTPSSIESSLFQGLGSSGDPSHLPHITQNFECQGEPAQQSCFTGVGRPLERIPYDPDREITAATAQPCTPVHQSREPEHARGVEKARKPQGRRRIKSPVKHTEENDREIQKLEPHLRSLVLFHFGNSEALQLFALKRILEYLQQCPPIHICRVDRKNGDRRSMILLVTCLLCLPGPEAPSPFKEPNAFPKFCHHFRTVHCDIKSPFACVVPPCDKSFSLRHDMTRHVKAAHPEFDGTAGDVEDGIPGSVVVSNAVDPFNTNRVFTGSSPILAQHNTSSFSSPVSGPNRRVELYPLQPMAPLNQGWNTALHVTQPGPFRIQPASGDIPIAMQSGGAGAGPSNSHRAGYTMSANPPSMGHSSSNRFPMSFPDAHGERYGGLSHISASGSNLPADYLGSHAQIMGALSSFLLSGNPGAVPSGTHSQIQSRRRDSSTVVAQMSSPVNSNYPTNAMTKNRYARPRQNHMSSSSAQRPRQPMPTQATARGVTQQWYDLNTRRAQAMHHRVDDMSTGLAYHPGELRYMPLGSQDPSTSSQTRHAGSIQQYQQQHPLLNQVDTTPNYNQHPPHPLWGLPQNSSNMGPSTFTHPSPDPGYPGHYGRTNRTRTKPPHNLGANVSLDRKTLKGRVEINFRNFLSWLGLIRLMVGVSEAFLSAILVLLNPPWERKGCLFSF